MFITQMLFVVFAIILSNVQVYSNTKGDTGHITLTPSQSIIIPTGDPSHTTTDVVIETANTKGDTGHTTLTPSQSIIIPTGDPSHTTTDVVIETANTKGDTGHITLTPSQSIIIPTGDPSHTTTDVVIETANTKGDTGHTTLTPSQSIIIPTGDPSHTTTDVVIETANTKGDTGHITLTSSQSIIIPTDDQSHTTTDVVIETANTKGAPGHTTLAATKKAVNVHLPVTSNPRTTMDTGKANLENAEFHLHFTLKFNLSYSRNLTVKTSAEYINYSTTFQIKLYEAYQHTEGFLGITIIGFSKGSVLCHYAVIYTANVNATTLINDLNDNVRSTLKDLQVLGKTTDEDYLNQRFTSELGTAKALVSSRCNAVGICQLGFNCTVADDEPRCNSRCTDFCSKNGNCQFDEDGNPFCKCKSDAKFIYGGERCEIQGEQLLLKSDYIIYIAAGGGGGLVLILVIALICTCAKKRKGKENRRKVSPTKHTNLSANGSFVHIPSPTEERWSNNNVHGKQRDVYEMTNLRRREEENPEPDDVRKYYGYKSNDRVDMGPPPKRFTSSRPPDEPERPQDLVYREGIPVSHSYADTEVLERRVLSEVRRHDHERQMSQDYRRTVEVPRGQDHFEERAVDPGYVIRDDRQNPELDYGPDQDYRVGIPRVQISRPEELPLTRVVEDRGLRGSERYLASDERIPTQEPRLVHAHSKERYPESPSPLRRFLEAESTQGSGRYSRNIESSHRRQESNGEIRRQELDRGFGRQETDKDVGRHDSSRDIRHQGTNRDIRHQDSSRDIRHQDNSRDNIRHENGRDARRQENDRDLRHHESSREIRRQESGRDSGRQGINRETKHRGSDRLHEDKRPLEQRRYSEGKMLGNLHRPHSFVAEPDSPIFTIGENIVTIPEADYDANHEHSSESNSANTQFDRRSRDNEYSRAVQAPSQYGVNDSPMARQLRKRAEELGKRRGLGHDDRPSPRVARKPAPDVPRDRWNGQQDRQFNGPRASRRPRDENTFF